MCKTDVCPTCEKISWRGCGQHIAQVMDAVDEEDWCTCLPTITVEGKEYPPKLD